MGLRSGGAFRSIRASILNCGVDLICWLSKLDVWCVCALRQIDADRIALAVGVIIFAKLLTQAAGLDPHDGIQNGVKRLRTIENLQGDVVAFQPLTAPSQGFIDEIFKEPLPALRLLEWAAVKDADQLLTNGL